MGFSGISRNQNKALSERFWGSSGMMNDVSVHAGVSPSAVLYRSSVHFSFNYVCPEAEVNELRRRPVNSSGHWRLREITLINSANCQQRHHSINWSSAHKQYTKPQTINVVFLRHAALIYINLLLSDSWTTFCKSIITPRSAGLPRWRTPDLHFSQSAHSHFRFATTKPHPPKLS